MKGGIVIDSNNFQSEVLSQLTACLVAVDRDREVSQLIQKLPSIADNPEFRYYKAISLVKQDRVGDALNELREIIKTKPEFEKAKELASHLYLHQITLSIKEKDYDKLSFLLNEAFQLLPEDEEITKEISKYKDIFPIVSIKAGNREKAAKYWKEKMIKNPQVPWTIYNLALLYYWWALGAEQDYGKQEKHIRKKYIMKNGKLVDQMTSGDLEEDPKLWRKAIAYWVMIINSNNFWKEWKDFREKSTGIKINDRDINNLRGSLLNERFKQHFKNQIESYKINNQEENYRKYLDLMADFLLEEKVALYYKDALEIAVSMGINLDDIRKRHQFICNIQKLEGEPCFATKRKNCEQKDTCSWAEYCMGGPSCWNKSISFSMPCGPLMLREMGICYEFGKLTEILSKLKPENQRLRKLKLYLGDFGKLLVLVEDLKMPEYAIEKWKRLSKSKKDTPDGKYTYIICLVKRAEVKERRKAYLDALDDLKKAKEYVNLLEHVKDKAFRRISLNLKHEVKKQVIDLCTNKGANVELNEAIRILTKGLEIVEDQSIKNILSNLYCGRGQKRLGRKLFQQARKDFSKALSLVPGNQTAKEGMATAYNNEGVKETDLDRSISLFRKALKYDPESRQIKENLAGAYNSKAVEIVNSINEYNYHYKIDDCKRAVNLLKKAIRLLNPSLEESTILVIEYAEDAIEELIKDLDDSLYKSVIINLAAVAKICRQIQTPWRY